MTSLYNLLGQRPAQVGRKKRGFATTCHKVNIELALEDGVPLALNHPG